MTNTPGEYKPSRRDVLRPIEYVGGAAIAAIFTGLVVTVTARDITLGLIIAGSAFIVVLVTLALLSMAIKPNAEETAEIDGEKPDETGPAEPETPGH